MEERKGIFMDLKRCQNPYSSAHILAGSAVLGLFHTSRQCPLSKLSSYVLTVITLLKLIKSHTGQYA